MDMVSFVNVVARCNQYCSDLRKVYWSHFADFFLSCVLENLGQIIFFHISKWSNGYLLHFKFWHDRRNGLWMLLISYQMWRSSENIQWIIHELSNYANSLELCSASISSDFREFSDRNYKLMPYLFTHSNDIKRISRRIFS